MSWECRDCHRPLKHPSTTGYGPTCARKRGLTPTRHTTTGRRTKPVNMPAAPDELPGQDALPLFFHQPTLASI